jgi:hypothetical protein
MNNKMNDYRVELRNGVSPTKKKCHSFDSVEGDKYIRAWNGHCRITGKRNLNFVVYHKAFL